MNKLMNEQLSIKDDMPIIARYYDYDMFKFPWHFHKEYEIIYVEEGSGDGFVADSKVSFQAGDIVMTGSNLPHYMKSRMVPDGSSRVKGAIVQFKDNFMQHSIQNYANLKNVKSLLHKSERGLYFPAPMNRKIERGISELMRSKGIRRLTALLLLLDTMASSKHCHILGSAQYRNTFPKYTDNRLEKILLYLRSHYTENINVGEIASLVSMNTSSFCRYFKEKSSKTVTQYIHDLRIGYACKLLLDDNADIFQISIECGFDTVSHFNRIFKRITGFNPTAYRKNFLRNGINTLT